MVGDKTYITQEGLENLREELKLLKTEKRKEISERIQEAKELGDLSENAEYTEAKEEQGFVEGRILDLENIIKNVEVIREDFVKSDIVEVGCTIKVQTNGNKNDYRIVGSSESDPKKGWISNESPLGRAFLGKKLGETVPVKTPKGELQFKILEIS